eukprot:SAG22_NODE_2985_length_2051_cov_3.540471_2_plen_293_part_01
MRAARLLGVLLLALDTGGVGTDAQLEGGEAAENEAKEWVPLEAGHANWTAKKLKASVLKKQKKPLVLVGFSSKSCGRFCAQFESVYADFTAQLDAEYGSPATGQQQQKKPQQVVFARMDGGKEQQTATRYGVDTLPGILAFKKGHKAAVTYNGVHSAGALLSYTKKALAPPVAKLAAAAAAAGPDGLAEAEAAVLAFVDSHNDSTVAIGFFKSEEADEYEDWRESAGALALRADAWLAELIDPTGDLLRVFQAKPHRWYKRAPAVVLFRRPLDSGGGGGGGGDSGGGGGGAGA